jgi:lipoate-protein ligase A
MKWTFMESGFLSGEQNMILDFTQAETMSIALRNNQDFTGHFRIYGWDKPTLSLGKNQVISRDIEVNCESLDIPIVRRPTGGRAVLHANELTYCIVMPCESMDIARNAYREIHAFFLRALNAIGVHNLDFAKSNADFHEHYTLQVSSACFSSSARYELTCNGKKLMGSAQRVFDGVLLQHGSLPLDQSYLNIVKLLTNDQEEQSNMKQNIVSHSTCLSECFGYSCEFSEIAQAIRDTWKVMEGNLPL